MVVVVVGFKYCVSSNRRLLLLLVCTEYHVYFDTEEAERSETELTWKRVPTESGPPSSLLLGWVDQRRGTPEAQIRRGSVGVVFTLLGRRLPLQHSHGLGLG